MTVSMSVCLGVEPQLRLNTDFFFLSVGRYCLQCTGASRDEKTGLPVVEKVKVVYLPMLPD